MTDLPLLISTLEEAGEGSRELDEELCRQFGTLMPFHPDPRCWRSGPKGRRYDVERSNGSMCGSTQDRYVPRYTGSLDSALTLIGERLPGAVWRLGFDPDDGSMKAEIVTAAPDCRAVRANHDEPAMALCLALCRALHSQGETHDA